MFARFGLCLLVVSLLSACTSVPDRYAPWRDNNNPEVGKKPNLADVPAAPNTEAAKAEMATMRQRLEQDRNNAYLAAQGIVPITDSSATAMPVVPANNIQSTDLSAPSGMTSTGLATNAPAPVGLEPVQLEPVNPSYNSVTTASLPIPTSTQPTAPMAGNVAYNYDPSANNDYTYSSNGTYSGGSVQVNSVADMVQSNDPSISIDWGALGGSPAASSRGGVMLSSSGTGLGAPVAYFAHGSAALGPKDLKAVRDLAKKLKQHPQTVMIAGNASKRTGIRSTAISRKVNLNMATKRANAVMSELVKQGVKADNLYVSAYGDSIPNRRPESYGEAADRRVEIIFDK